MNEEWIQEEDCQLKKLRENEHFKHLVQLARRGKVILIIGTGVSVDAGMPSTGQLLKALQAEIRELGGRFHAKSLSEAANELEKKVGRLHMVEILRREFDAAARTGLPPYRQSTYRLLSALPRELTREVFTTNWDDLIERAFREVRESAVEIWAAEQLPGIHSVQHAIIKLHGSFEAPKGIVITDSDHEEARKIIQCGTVVGTLWGHLSARLAEYHFVFLGCSLGDPSLKLVRKAVELRTDGEKRHFLVGPLSPEDVLSAEDWAGVRPIPATATGFLLALFKELDEFVNRQEELDLVFRHSSPPFVEFHGPFGSGKTALLDAAERRAKVEGWSPRQVVRVNWDRRPDGTSRGLVENERQIIQVLNEELNLQPRLKQLETLGDHLRDRQGVFLIFDATENVQNQHLVSLLSGIVAPTIREMIERGWHSKLLLAGRLPMQDWPYEFRRDMSSKVLTPFTTPVVWEMAEKFLLATDPASQERFGSRLLEDILTVSDGNAGFIKAVLGDLTARERQHDGRIQIPDCLTSEEQHRYAVRFNKEADQYILWESTAQKTTYENDLCVFRWLNPEIVQQLSIGVPILDLVAIHVLDETFQADTVIRHIKTFWLRYEHLEQYRQAHASAQSIFANGMDQVACPMQLEYVAEWLFHTSHLLLIQESESQSRCQKLVDQIRARVRYRVYPEQVRTSPGVELVCRITDVDQELRTLLERCTGEERVEHVLEALKQREGIDVRSVQNTGS